MAASAPAQQHPDVAASGSGLVELALSLLLVEPAARLVPLVVEPAERPVDRADRVPKQVRCVLVVVIVDVVAVDILVLVIVYVTLVDLRCQAWDQLQRPRRLAADLLHRVETGSLQRSLEPDGEC
jgi:hypothetical protein